MIFFSVGLVYIILTGFVNIITNNSTFVSCGTQGDAIRNITGYVRNGAGCHIFNDAEGVFTLNSLWNKINLSSTSEKLYANVYFNAANVVPVANENSVRALSERFWRRVV
jgi:formate/nitrite transporter FocA (FNT family)